jgi:DNA-binding LytR/AlgR family response regulator
MENEDCYIWVKTSVYLKRVLIDSILLCKAEDHKVDIYFHPEGKLEGTRHSLEEFENLLPKCKFCRCNRQYIINVDQVDKYSEKIPEVVLINGLHVQVSKDRKDNLSKLLGFS